MNEKSYNMYLRMVKLACKNVKQEICRENGIRDTQSVNIKVRDKDGLIGIVAAIMQSPEAAEVIYKSRVEKRLVVITDTTLLHKIDFASVFIQSILKSRSARIFQKQIVNYLMAERYLDAAWDYDFQNKNASGSNLEKAKNVIIKKYSLNFLGGFVFDGRPRIEPNILLELRTQAFDPRYAMVTEEQNAKLVEKKYIKEFETRDDVFLTATPQTFKVNTIKDSKQKSMMDVFIRKSKKSETDIIAELYQMSFADIPLQKRRRRFVNLRSKNYDVSSCPERNLSVKKQFSQIEATTKHAYIMNYFNDHIESGVDRPTYYFQQEAWMYRYIWQIEGEIYARDGMIYLPDDRAVEIPDTMTDYEFFHRVNTVYAALFGFTPDDVVGGNNWLIDSIRKAYTEEGNALYRLTIIDKRLESIDDSKRKERNKW